MAQQVYRANIKVSDFPFLSEQSGRSVIYRGQDQNYVANVNSQVGVDAGKMGIPQLMYAHNVLPTAYGYSSISFHEYASAVHAVDVGFYQVVEIRDDTGNLANVSMDASGNIYVMDKGTSVWVPAYVAEWFPAPLSTWVQYVASDLVGRRITAAYVNGKTYVMFGNFRCAVYNWSTGQFEVTVLSGLTITDIRGLVGDSGYLIAYSKNSLAWSSTVDPADFVPSLVTGAGGGSVEGALGNIITVESVYGGIVILTDSNAVAGAYSGNSRYPYTFTGIAGCGGLEDAKHVAYNSNTSTLFAYTTYGVQQITLQKAAVVFPVLTEFLAGSLLEDFDELTNTFTTIDTVGSQIQKRIAIVADRYVIFSYGATSLTHAIVYDTALKQFGKLKFEHTVCFEFKLYAAGAVEVPKKNVAFLGAGGNIHILDTNVRNSDADGIAIFGKFQYVRSRWLHLHEVEIENTNTSYAFTLFDIPTFDGKTFEPAVAGTLAENGAQIKKYYFDVVAFNHSLLLKGAFELNTLLLTYSVHGGV